MKNKHLTLSDRNDIQIGIEQLKPFSAIAAKLGKDPSTISKEVRRNMVIKENSSTANCEACPLLKKAPYVCIQKREATADTRNSSTTQKELSLIMKLSSRSREQALP